MSSCSGLEDVQVVEAIQYYNEMLLPVSRFYTVFHVYVYHILCVIGVLTNICIVVVLCQPSMRKNPFNLFLIAIAFCDLSLMASYLIFKQIDNCHPWYFTHTWTVFTLAYACLSVFIHSASLWLTVNMAVLRYLVLRESSKSGASKLNNYTAALMAIMAGVFISLIGSTPNMLKYTISDRDIMPLPSHCFNTKYDYKPGQQVHNYSFALPSFWSCWLDRLTFWVAGILLKIIPCLLLTIFMAMLVKMLIEARDRRSRLCSSTTGSASGSHGPGSSVAGKSQAERTTTMLVIIVAVFLVTELPQGILVVATGIQPSFRFAMPHLGDLVDLLSLLNSSVNFILYSTTSVLFRREFLRTFGFCLPQPLRQWHSKRKLKSNGSLIKRVDAGIQTPTRKPNYRPGFATVGEEQTERLIENGKATTNLI